MSCTLSIKVRRENTSSYSAPCNNEGAKYSNDAEDKRDKVPLAIISDASQARELRLELGHYQTLSLGIAPIELCINVLILDCNCVRPVQRSQSSCVLTMLKSSSTDASTMPSEKMAD